MYITITYNFKTVQEAKRGVTSRTHPRNQCTCLHKAPLRPSPRSASATHQAHRQYVVRDLPANPYAHPADPMPRKPCPAGEALPRRPPAQTSGSGACQLWGCWLAARFGAREAPPRACGSCQTGMTAPKRQRESIREEVLCCPDGHPNSPTCGHLKFLHPELGEMTG